MPIEGEADVAMQVNAVTAGIASKRRVEMDQYTLAAQARDTWHSIQDCDSCRLLPIGDATLLELKPKLLHMRTLHEVFYKIKYHTSWHHTIIITTAVAASMDGGWWPLIKLQWH